MEPRPIGNPEKQRPQIDPAPPGPIIVEDPMVGPGYTGDPMEPPSRLVRGTPNSFWLVLLAWLGLVVALATKAGPANPDYNDLFTRVLAPALVIVPPALLLLLLAISRSFRQVVFGWDVRILLLLNMLRMSGFGTLVLAWSPPTFVSERLPATWGTFSGLADICVAVLMAMVGVRAFLPSAKPPAGKRAGRLDEAQRRKLPHRDLSWGGAVGSLLLGLCASVVSDLWAVTPFDSAALQGILGVPYFIVPLFVAPLLALFDLAALIRLVLDGPPAIEGARPGLNNAFSPSQFSFKIRYRRNLLKDWWVRTIYRTTRPYRAEIMNYWYEMTARHYPTIMQTHPAQNRIAVTMMAALDDAIEYGLRRKPVVKPPLQWDPDSATAADGKSPFDWADIPWKKHNEPPKTDAYDVHRAMYLLGYQLNLMGALPNDVALIPRLITQAVRDAILDTGPLREARERINPALAEDYERRAPRAAVFNLLRGIQRVARAWSRLTTPLWYLVVGPLRRVFHPSAWEPKKDYVHRVTELNERSFSLFLSLFLQPVEDYLVYAIDLAVEGVRQSQADTCYHTWERCIEPRCDEIADTFWERLLGCLGQHEKTRPWIQFFADWKHPELFWADERPPIQSKVSPELLVPWSREKRNALFRSYLTTLMSSIRANGLAARFALQQIGATHFRAGWPGFGYDFVRSAFFDAIGPALEEHFGPMAGERPFPLAAADDPSLGVRRLHFDLLPFMRITWESMYTIARVELVTGSALASGQVPGRDPIEVTYALDYAWLKREGQL